MYGRARRGVRARLAAEVFDAPHARDDGRDRWMRERELDGGFFEAHAVTLAHRANALCPLDELGRRGPVVERRPGPGIGQEAGVHHATRDDSDAAPDAQREELGERRLVEERVAA